MSGLPTAVCLCRSLGCFVAFFAASMENVESSRLFALYLRFLFCSVAYAGFFSRFVFHTYLYIYPFYLFAGKKAFPPSLLLAVLLFYSAVN